MESSEKDVLKMLKEGMKLAKYETDYLRKEINILENLRQALNKKDVSKLREALREISNLENVLYNLSNNVLHDIDVVKNLFPKKKVKLYTDNINDCLNRIYSIINSRTGSLIKYVHGEIDFDHASSEIQTLELNIGKLITTLNEASEEFKVERKKYKKELAASKEKISDLLKGEGNYRGYTLEQRRELWNRYSRITDKKVIKDLNLSKIDLSKFNFVNFVFKDTYFEGANLEGAKLQGANLERANLSRADLSGADLSGANLQEANLQEANLSGYLKGANLKGANLKGANLMSAYLERANLSGADLSGADLEGANLQEADLSGANLNGANLQEADLSGANLKGANLSGAGLRGADLKKANLKKANLTRANLGGADLIVASLKGANLKGANFKYVKNCPISKEELKRRGAIVEE